MQISRNMYLTVLTPKIAYWLSHVTRSGSVIEDASFQLTSDILMHSLIAVEISTTVHEVNKKEASRTKVENTLARNTENRPGPGVVSI